MSVPAGSSHSPVEEALDRLADEYVGRILSEDESIQADRALATVRGRLERLTEERETLAEQGRIAAARCGENLTRRVAAEAEVTRLTGLLEHTTEGLRDYDGVLETAIKELNARRRERLLRTGGAVIHEESVRDFVEVARHIRRKYRALRAVSSRPSGDTEPDGGGAKSRHGDRLAQAKERIEAALDGGVPLLLPEDRMARRDRAEDALDALVEIAKQARRCYERGLIEVTPDSESLERALARLDRPSSDGTADSGATEEGPNHQVWCGSLSWFDEARGQCDCGATEENT